MQRAQVVQQMTRIKNSLHSVLHANLISPFEGDLFSQTGRPWLETQPLAADERIAVRRHLADLDQRCTRDFGRGIADRHRRHHAFRLV